MNAWLYECQVMHERLRPVHHRFTYRTAYLCVDTGALGSPGPLPALFSVNRRNAVSLWERDYLPTHEPVHPPAAGPAPAAQGTLAERVVAFCRAGGRDPGPGARLLLVTMPRVLGYGFNPVSFHYCSAADGTPVAAVAEVTNTFREVKPYLVPPKAGAFHSSASKEFYVSPFSSAGLAFDFDLEMPGETLSARINTLDADGIVVRTSLGGRRRPLTGAAIAALLLRYPLLPLTVMTRIHAQAARLWLKKVPHFRKADELQLQRGLYRPHPSIRSHPSP